MRYLISIFFAAVLVGCGGGESDHPSADVPRVNRDWEAPAQLHQNSSVVYYDSDVAEYMRPSLFEIDTTWRDVAACAGITPDDPPTVYWTSGWIEHDGSQVFGLAFLEKNTIYGSYVNIYNTLDILSHEFVHIALFRIGIPNTLNSNHQHEAFERCS